MASRGLIVMVAFLLTCITYTVYAEEDLKTDEAAKRRPPPRFVLEKGEDKRRPAPKSVYYQAFEKHQAEDLARREQEQGHRSPFTELEEPMEKRRPPPKSVYKVEEESKRRPPPRYQLADIESRYPVKRRPPPQIFYKDLDFEKRRPPPRSVFLRSRPLQELVSGSAEEEMKDRGPPDWVYADQSRRRTSPSRGSPSLASYYTSDDTEDEEFRPPPWVYAGRAKRRMPPPWILQQARLLEAELEREEADRYNYNADDSDWETADDQKAVRPPAWVYAGRARVNKAGLDKPKVLEQYDNNKWRLVPDYYSRDQGMVRSAKSCVPSGEYCTSCDCNCCSKLCLWHPSAGLVYSKCVSPAICDPSFAAILASASFECRKQ
ncbi:Hypp7002 [Branchiostoma lanceolatum]|uniref:Hypp7002 protein n=2 Tax=Branchiostoma lanceolatum TaxID=7740 RepID=A0A8J9YWE3_BRALA|nr:Hypp7002 [Branchiostoma lanceolatum]